MSEPKFDLHEKRNAFPRFYFLSYEEICEVLEKRDTNLSSLFGGINSLEFDANQRVTALISKENERLPLESPIEIYKDPIEFLRNLEKAMKSAVKSQIKQALNDYNGEKREEWMNKWPLQAVVVAAQIVWCNEITAILQSGSNVTESLKEFDKKSLAYLKNLCLKARQNLSQLEKLTLEALVTNDLHARKIVQSLIAENVNGDKDAAWTTHLRFYWDSTADGVKIETANLKSLNYGYEYFGAFMRLAKTTVTEQCYNTLLAALNEDLIGSLSGQAGIGKTETIRELARDLGQYNVVINCSDNFDDRILNQFVSGAAAAGAWTIYDEFNRFEPAAIETFQRFFEKLKKAKESNAKNVQFLDKSVDLKPNCGVFITLNPAYAGRTEMPESLNAYCKEIKMGRPDFQPIINVSLFAKGFEDSEDLSKRLIELFHNLKETLSRQAQYDFGFRCLDFIVQVAGKRFSQHPDENPRAIFVQAIQDIFAPRLTREDATYYAGILNEKFAGLMREFNLKDPLVVAITEALKKLGLKSNEYNLARIKALHDLLEFRTGVIVMGKSGTAKSTLIQVLELLMKDHFKADIDVVTITDPASKPMSELYGEFVGENEWKDGVLTAEIRKASSKKNHNLIVLDGKIKPIWVENLNTVLDKNKVLCLVNGDMIHVNDKTHLIFEVKDLDDASPAMISRCGVIYLDENKFEN